MPIVPFKGNMSDYFCFSLSLLLSVFLCPLFASAFSEDHFIPNLHVYYTINNIQIAQSHKLKQPSRIVLALSSVSDMLDAFDDVFICSSSIIIGNHGAIFG